MIAACLPNPKKYTIKPLSRPVAIRYPWIMRQVNNLSGDEDLEKIVGRVGKCAIVLLAFMFTEKINKKC